MNRTSWYCFIVLLLAAACILIIAWAFMQGGNAAGCESLEECVQNANVHGTYDAVYYNSYSSPGGTATTMRTYTISNEKLIVCTGCEATYSSGYGTTEGECPGGEHDCSETMKQTDILDIVTGMNVSGEFYQGSSKCFRGRTASDEPLDAIVCFDEANRVVNYAEQGRRPLYRFSISGYETELSFLD